MIIGDQLRATGLVGVVHAAVPTASATTRGAICTECFVLVIVECLICAVASQSPSAHAESEEPEATGRGEKADHDEDGSD